MTKPNTTAPARMETIAAYIFQNENLLQEALIMHYKSNTHPWHKGRARLSNTGPFRNIYVTDDGFLIADNTSDLYINEGERCTYCTNWYETRTLNINCHLVAKLTENTSKLWIDLYNHIIPIVEAYHNDGIPAEPSADKLPMRRESIAAYILESPQKLDDAATWWTSPKHGSPVTDSEQRIKIDSALFAAIEELYKNGGKFIGIDNTKLSELVSKSTNTSWIDTYNALLPIAELYHAFTIERNTIGTIIPTTDDKSVNVESVAASEQCSKVTATYICGKCDTEHNSITSAALCCPDVSMSYTCNECNAHYDTQDLADFCCSSIKTEHPHPSDHKVMLHACRTCNTIPFGDAEHGAQQCAADQHCNSQL